jgi:hypothetical protein
MGLTPSWARAWFTAASDTWMQGNERSTPDTEHARL